MGEFFLYLGYILNDVNMVMTALSIRPLMCVVVVDNYYPKIRVYNTNTLQEVNPVSVSALVNLMPQLWCL